MPNQPFVILYEFNRLVKDAHQESINSKTYHKQLNNKEAFLNVLSRKVEYFSFSLQHYLLTDRIVGFYIQPTSYHSSCHLCENEIATKIELHYHPPVRYSPIQAPEMILDLQFVIHKNGQLTYKIANYLADPSFVQSNIATILPNGCNMVLNEDGSISIEQLDWMDPGSNNNPPIGFGTYSGNNPCDSHTQGRASDPQGNGLADYIELAGDLGGPIGEGAKNILNDRGAYMPRGRIYRINKPVTVRTPVVNINTTSKVLNYAHVGGKVLVIGGVVATGYQVYDDAFNEGKYFSAGTRLAVAGVAAGAAFVPVVGWVLAAGIGVADFVWGDQFYNWVETKMAD